jgi:hypothetical protein
MGLNEGTVGMPFVLAERAASEGPRLGQSAFSCAQGGRVRMLHAVKGIPTILFDLQR